MRNDIISEIKSGINKHRYFLIIIFAMIVLLISSSLDILTLVIISSIFLFIASLFYIKKSEIKTNDIFEKLLLWIAQLILLLILILLVLLHLQELQLALLVSYGIALCSVVFSCIGLRIQLSNFWESRDLKSLIASYIFIVVVLIPIFGSFFSALSYWEGNELKWVIDDSKVSGLWSFSYFSAQTFYSTNFGDIVPLGYSRIIAVTEMIVSAVLHIIAIGMLLATKFIQNLKK